jgi:hypothetical protein
MAQIQIVLVIAESGGIGDWRIFSTTKAGELLAMGTVRRILRRERLFAILPTLAQSAKQPMKRFLVWVSCHALLPRCVVQGLFRTFGLRSV